jgi:predicted kinase
MDLEAHDQAWAARELVSAYVQAGGSVGSESLRSFYAAHRALVRAKVTLIDAAEHKPSVRGARIECAERLWDLAVRLCWRARRPLVIVVCGPAASGKSTLAAELSRRSELPVVSSDVIRKQMAGVAADERARPEHYTDEFTQRTYGVLGSEALRHLRRDDGVIVDATCRTERQRAVLLRGLDQCAVTRLVVVCQVRLETALARAARRMRSSERVSDATPQIVAEQFRSFQQLDEVPPGCLLALNTEQTINVQVVEVTRTIDERLSLTKRTPSGDQTARRGTCFSTAQSEG